MSAEQMRKEFEAFLKEEAPAIYDASNADARYIWTKAWQAALATQQLLPAAWMTEDGLTVTAKTKDTLPPGSQAYFPIPLDLTPKVMRDEWLQAGGQIHGPNVETVSMPESLYFKFRGRRLGAPAPTVLTVAAREESWTHISEQWPEHGQRIEGENHFGEKWIEVWDASKPLGPIVHWRPAAPKEQS